jgi:uncharacterized protein (DUF1697 family)
MSAHIALLRAVNVGGCKPAIMAELRKLLVELGFGDVHSILQTGNLVFRGGARTGDDLERFLEQEAAKRLDLHTDFFVRSEEEWKRIIAQNPFQDQAKRDAARLVVMFLKRAPGGKEVEALQTAIRGPEMVRTESRQVYIVYPAGIGRSPLTNTLLEKKFGTRGTARNWNTVQKLGSFVNEALHFPGPL